MIRRDQSGVTLVELMVVLVIIVVLGAVAYALLDNVLQVLTTKGAGEQLAGALRQARQYAITEGGAHCIEWPPMPTTQYTIKVAVPSGGTFTCTGATVVGATDLAPGARIQSTTPASTTAVVFSPVGNMAVPAAPSLTVTVDTTPSCPSAVLVTLYGGVRVTKC